MIILMNLIRDFRYDVCLKNEVILLSPSPILKGASYAYYMKVSQSLTKNAMHACIIAVSKSWRVSLQSSSAEWIDRLDLT